MIFGRRALVWTLIAGCLVVNIGICRAEESASWKKRWIASIALLAAANVADIHSTARVGAESNPLLRSSDGRFSLQRGVAIKSGALAGSLLVQSILAKKKPEQNLYKPFTIGNAVTAGALTGIAVRNYGIGAGRGR